jgi:diguanylate cyclase (GGDEF)-like protein
MHMQEMSGQHPSLTPRRPLLTLIIAFTVFVLATVWLTTITQISHDQRQTETVASQQASDIARAVDARLAERIARIDQALLFIRKELHGNPDAAPSQLAKVANGMNDVGLMQIALLDDKGRLVGTTLFPPNEQEPGSQDAFRWHRAWASTDGDDRLRIGKPILDRSSGEWSLHFSRSLLGQDGRFLGAVTIAINPFAFSRLAKDLPIGKKGVVTVVGMDRIIRMIHTAANDEIRRERIGRELPADRAQFDVTRPDADVMRMTSSIDGRPFVAAYRRAATQPLVSMVLLSEEELYAQLTERASFLLAAASLVSVIILLFAAGLIGLSLRQHRTSAALAAANRLLRENERVLEARVADRTMALEDAVRHAHDLADRDPLTSLPNRAAFIERASRVFSSAVADASSLMILFLDIDRFKVINDTLGHSAGDQLLVAVAQRLKAAVRPTDMVARLGGDEFVVLADGVSSVTDAAQLAERIKIALGAPLVLNERALTTGVSIGIARHPDDGRDASSLLKHADMAMYAAKAAGRNTMRMFTSDMSQAADRRLDLELALRRAIERSEFSLVYQPKLELSTGRLCGVEALVRWNHPERGLIPPGDFIPLAEETGLIEPLGQWVLEEACRVLASWDSGTFGPLTIAVNVAAAQVNRGDLAAVAEGLVRQYHIDPGSLEIEVTETAVIADHGRAQATLNRLRSLGIAVALDDFGTGYSSLIYLRRLDIDTVKIDQSFVQHARDGSRDGDIVRMIVEAARTLKLSVVAEGVETAKQAAFLQGLGCDMIQGYLVARPMPLEQLKTWILNRQVTGPRRAPQLSLVPAGRE